MIVHPGEPCPIVCGLTTLVVSNLLPVSPRTQLRNFPSLSILGLPATHDFRRGPSNRRALRRCVAPSCWCVCLMRKCLFLKPQCVFRSCWADPCADCCRVSPLLKREKLSSPLLQLARIPLPPCLPGHSGFQDAHLDRCSRLSPHSRDFQGSRFVNLCCRLEI